MIRFWLFIFVLCYSLDMLPIERRHRKSKELANECEERIRNNNNNNNNNKFSIVWHYITSTGYLETPFSIFHALLATSGGLPLYQSMHKAFNIIIKKNNSERKEAFSVTAELFIFLAVFFLLPFLFLTRFKGTFSVLKVLLV